MASDTTEYESIKEYFEAKDNGTVSYPAFIHGLGYLYEDSRVQTKPIIPVRPLNAGGHRYPIQPLVVDREYRYGDQFTYDGTIYIVINEAGYTGVYPFDSEDENIRALATQEYVEEAIQDFIPDAPQDGTLYGRQDGAWSEVEAGSSETPETIKTKYESNTDTNAYTDSEKTKLEGHNYNVVTSVLPSPMNSSDATNQTYLAGRKHLGTGATGSDNISLTPATATKAGLLTASTQTIGGVKTFSSSPTVPTPTNSGDAVNKGYVDEGFVEDVTNGSDTGSYVPYVRFRDHYGSRGYWFPLWSVTRARYLGLYVTMQDLVNSYGYSESTVGAYAVVGDYSDPNKKIYMAVYFDYNASPQQIIWQEISNEQAPPLENPFLSKDLLALGTIEADNEITLLNVYDHTNDPDANISQYMGVYDVLPETPERSKTLIGVKVIRNDGYIISRLFTTGTIPPGQSRRISKIICSNGGISFVMRDQNEEALGLAGGSLPTTNFKQIILVTESRPSSWYRLIGYTAKRGN